MNSPILIGIGAGLVSAVLFASTLTGTVLAMMLFYITAMPGFLAGLGWGTQSAIITALVGTGLTGLLLSPLTGLAYFLALGLPIAVLCHFALLARPASEAGDATASAPAGAIEWYPPGRIVAITVLMAGSVAALSIPLLGMDIESYRSNLQEIIDKTFLSRLPDTGDISLEKEKLTHVIEMLVRALPAASAIVWFCIMLLNMWSAARIVTLSGRSIRPWPELAMMRYPNKFALGFVASLFGTFSPGILSIVATGFAGAFLIAYVLLGLVILHVLARNTPFKFALMGALYFGIFLFGWVALVVAIIGIGDPMFKFRERAMRPAPPPPGPPQGKD